MREAQAAFNSWVRLRDAALGCVSCDKPATWAGQWHASHFRSVGSSPEHRFNPLNVHRACSVCNNHLSGNILGYQPELIRRIGAEAGRGPIRAQRAKALHHRRPEGDHRRVPGKDQRTEEGPCGMKISQEELKSLLSYDPETGAFTWRLMTSPRVKAGDRAGYFRKRDGYIVVRIHGYGYSAHRLAWFYVHGIWPGMIDHKDRNRANNTHEKPKGGHRFAKRDEPSLPAATHQVIAGLPGTEAPGAGRPSPGCNGKNHYLGLFKSAAAASDAYEAFCRQHHGQFYVGNQRAAA